MMRKKNNNQSGFTLLEVMVTVALIGILLAIAVPTYTAITQRLSLGAGAQTLVKAFALARVEAVTTPQATINVCWDFRAVGQFPNPAALPGALGGQTIDAGEIVVFRNTLQGLQGQPSVTEIISSTQLVIGRGSLGVTSVVNLPNNCVGFDSQGRLTNNGNLVPVGFLFCQNAGTADNTRSIRVEINNSGRAVSKDNSVDVTGLGTQACP